MSDVNGSANGVAVLDVAIVPPAEAPAVPPAEAEAPVVKKKRRTKAEAKADEAAKAEAKAEALRAEAAKAKADEEAAKAAKAPLDAIENAQVLAEISECASSCMVYAERAHHAGTDDMLLAGDDIDAKVSAILLRTGGKVKRAAIMAELQTRVNLMPDHTIPLSLRKPGEWLQIHGLRRLLAASPGKPAAGESRVFASKIPDEWSVVTYDWYRNVKWGVKPVDDVSTDFEFISAEAETEIRAALAHRLSGHKRTGKAVAKEIKENLAKLASAAEAAKRERMGKEEREAAEAKEARTKLEAKAKAEAKVISSFKAKVDEHKWSPVTTRRKLEAAGLVDVPAPVYETCDTLAERLATYPDDMSRLIEALIKRSLIDPSAHKALRRAARQITHYLRTRAEAEAAKAAGEPVTV